MGAATELGVKLSDIGLSPVVEPALGDEVLQVGLDRIWHPDGHPDQPGRDLAAAPGGGAHLIDHRPVGGDTLVTVLDAQVAPGAVRPLKPCADRVQVGEVVGPEVANEQAGVRACGQYITQYKLGRKSS